MSRVFRELSLFWTLLLNAFAPRNRRDGFRLVWVVVEPVGQLAILMLVFLLIGRAALYGPSVALFLLSGIAPLSLMTAVSTMVNSAIVGLDSTNRLPTIGLYHEALARAAFNLIVTLVYMSALMYAIGAVLRVDVAPQRWPLFVGGLLWLTVMGFGVGLLRGYASLYFPIVERMYGILARGLLFISGVFYVPSFMPPQLRDWLSWNPVLHGVELFRIGLYGEYPDFVYAPGFLVGFSLGTVALGMAMTWRARSRIMG